MVSNLNVVDNNKLCRLCLSVSNESYINSFVLNGNATRIYNIILDLNINIVLHPKLPNKLCQNCLNTLTNFHAFKLKIKQNEQLLWKNSTSIADIMSANVAKNSTDQNQMGAKGLLENVSDEPISSAKLTNIAKKILEHDCASSNFDDRTSSEIIIADGKIMRVQNMKNSYILTDLNGKKECETDVIRCVSKNLSIFHEDSGMVIETENLEGASNIIKNISCGNIDAYENERTSRDNSHDFNYCSTEQSESNVPLPVCEDDQKCTNLATSEVTGYMCGYCKHFFDRYYFLMQHLLLHSQQISLFQQSSMHYREIPTSDIPPKWSHHVEQRKNFKESSQYDKNNSSHIYEIEVVDQNNSASKSHRCTICLRVFNNSIELKAHFLNHSQAGENPEIICTICPICGRIFRHFDQFRRHTTEVCHTNQSYACNKCCKRYNYEVNLLKHEDKICGAYSQLSNVSCVICEQNFSSRVVLEAHCLIHIIMAPVCETCKQSFICGEALHRHRSSFHSGTNKNDNSGHKIKSCQSDVGLRRNFRRLNWDCFNCSDCSFSTKSREEFTFHRNYHLSQPYQCRVVGCGKLFNSRSNLNYHRKTHQA